MQTILDLFYDAPIGYNGKLFKQNSDFVKTARVKDENLYKLKELLTDEQKALFEAYSEAAGDMEEIITYRKFTYGFHLGSLLMLEIMEGKTKMLEEIPR